MKPKLIFFLTLIISSTTIIAENPLSIELLPGANNFTIQEYFYPIYISNLIKENPEIQSASLKEYGQTFGYVNTFGGIGTNFIIESNRQYEIYVNQSITIFLKG